MQLAMAIGDCCRRTKCVQCNFISIAKPLIQLATTTRVNEQQQQQQQQMSIFALCVARQKKQTHFGQLQLESLYQFGIYSLTFAPTWATTNGEATNNSCPSLSRSATIRSDPTQCGAQSQSGQLTCVSLLVSEPSLHLHSGQIYNLLPFLDAPKMKMSTALLLLLFAVVVVG